MEWLRQPVLDRHTQLATYSHMMGQMGWLKHDRIDGVCCRLLVLFHK